MGLQVCCVAEWAEQNISVSGVAGGEVSRGDDWNGGGNQRTEA